MHTTHEEESVHSRPGASTPSPEGEEAEAFLSLVESFLLGTSSLGDVLGIGAEEVESMAEVGDQFLAGGQVEQAQEVYEGCVVLNPVDPALVARLATCADLLGQVEERDQCTHVLTEILEDDEKDAYEALLGELARDAVEVTG